MKLKKIKYTNKNTLYKYIKIFFFIIIFIYHDPCAILQKMGTK